MPVAIRVLHPVAPADLVAITRLHDDAEAVDGHPSLNEAVWRDLDAPGSESAGVLATEGSAAIAYAHVARSDNFSPPHWAAGLVVHPERRDGLESELLTALVGHVRERGGGPVVLWALAADERLEGSVARAGFRPQRTLLELRVRLPLAEEPAFPTTVTVRTFVPGRDETAWLEVNNRAFADHPEQGEWVESTLRRRMAEPWFDPEGFLLAVDHDGLAGFCWTKIHPPSTGEAEARGEIFVIGVDPSRQGAGLGRALSLAGLASLAQRGVSIGTLFVDASNTSALRLYESLGFRTHRRDRAYQRVVEPIPGAGAGSARMSP